jgi:hypothetical protein
MTKVTGEIKFQKKIMSEGKECYGICRGNGQKFGIRVSQEAAENLEIFTETLLHEFFHLSCFIVSGFVKADLSEREHHRIMKPEIERLARKLTKAYERRMK